jgi:chorismate lyase/3-hydroxybenzoate synthase
VYHPPARKKTKVPGDPANQMMSQSVSDPQKQPARAAAAQLSVGYYAEDSLPESPDSILAEIHFGNLPQAASTGLRIDVALDPICRGPAPVEVWHAQGPVKLGMDGAIRFAHDGHHVFAVLEADELAHGGILGAAEFVYAEVRRFQQDSPYRHILRMWNYLDAANEGSGDMERYRQFCVGRARGLDDSIMESYPAASAVGRQRPTGSLQVYWLAGGIAGVAVENPRQVSAYRYPHIYGPTSPSFSRATIAPDDTLLISGTASILGHASHHIGDATAQLDETLRNLEALIGQAAKQGPGLNTGIAGQTTLKVYVRDATQKQMIDEHLKSRIPDVSATYLAADICRKELLLEIECAQRASDK